jgi:hypothetical protein
LDVASVTKEHHIRGGFDVYITKRRMAPRSSPTRCEICGMEFFLGNIGFALIDESQRYHDTCWGLVCNRCVGLNAEQRTRLLDQHAAQLRRLADDVDEIAAQGIRGLCKEDGTALAAEDEATLAAEDEATLAAREDDPDVPYKPC